VIHIARGDAHRELVAMASELLAWMAMLALDGPARAWASLITTAISRLHALAPADQREPPRPRGKETAARGTPPTRRDSRATGYGRTLNQQPPYGVPEVCLSYELQRCAWVSGRP